MGDWYLISLSDLLGVDKSIACIESKDNELVPKYSSLLLDNFEIVKKYGIDKILIKQIDINGRKFKEISSNLIIGSIAGSEALAINMNERKAASNEEIIEYICYMQGVCRILVTRFDILNYELKNVYELCKTSFEKVRQIIEIKKSQKRNSKVIEFPGSTSFAAVSETVHNGQIRLTLLNGKKI